MTNDEMLAQHGPREAMEVDVVVVGAGPAGLSAAIRLKQLAPDASVEKNLTTEVAEAGNNAGGQGTVGEQVTYTFSVVVPRGTTARANSAGVASELSMWTCASMKPGATKAPPRSIVSRAA